jgi:hypothetical protein
MLSHQKTLAIFNILLIALFITACTPTEKTTDNNKENIEESQKESGIDGDGLSISDDTEDSSGLSTLAISSLTLSIDETKLFVDQDAMVSVEITYEDDTTSETDDDLVFESSDTDIAEVSSNGRLTLKQPGEVSIVAQAGDASDSITLTVLTSELHFVLWITDDSSKMTIYSDDNSDLTLTVSDEQDCLPADCEQNTKITIKPNQETPLDEITITTDTRFQISVDDNTHSNVASFIDKKIFSARKYHRAIVFNNKIWVIGGRTGSGDNESYLNDVWSSSDGSLWTEVLNDAEFSGRENHGLSVLDNKLILTGGWNENDKALQDVWETEDGESFTQLIEQAPFPPRDSHQMVNVNETLYLMTGWTEENGCNSYNDVWRTQNGTDWTKVTESTAFSKRCASAATAFNDTIYLTGGMEGADTSRRYLNDVWSSTDGENFNALTGSAQFDARFKHQLTVFKETLYLSGGFSGNNEKSYYNDIWKSADGVQWELVTEAPSFSARAGHQMLTKGEWLYIIGGYNDQTTFQDVWRSKDGKVFEKRQAGSFPFD